VQLLHFSDWHAQLDPVTQRNGSRAGGAAVLRAYFNQDKVAQPNTIVTTGGDEFGASPPLASLNNEEPAVRALNLMGLQVSTLGNHNFDKGLMHLQQMLAVADYTPVSTNIANLASNGLTDAGEVAVPFHIVEVGGVRVAFVGLTNTDAPTLIRPGNTGSLAFSSSIADTVVSANAARTQAAAQGATVFVALAHMGITQAFAGTGTPVGPLADLATALGSTNWDLLLGDHTNLPLNTVINGLRTVECSSQGQQYARIILDLDPTSERPVAINVTLVTPTVTPEIEAALALSNPVETMLMPYRTTLAANLDPKIGEASGIFPRGGTPAVERTGEAAIGNLVAQSLWYSDVLFGTPATVDMALVNGGGIRSAIPSSYVPSDTLLRRPPAATMGPYDLVRGDVFSVLPFGNGIVWLTITGAQLWAALEHAVTPLPAADGRYPQIAGFTFTYDVARPAGQRVVAVRDWAGNDVANSAARTYRLATSDFLFYGGDGYTMFAGVPSEVRQELMAGALEAYIAEVYANQQAVTPTLDGRVGQIAQVLINEVNPNTTEDKVELRVITNGNLLGLRLDALGLAGGPETLAVFGDVRVAAGDLVVLHLFTPAQLTTYGVSANTAEFTRTDCTQAFCYPGAFDIMGSGNDLKSTRRVLQVRDARGGIQDAVAFSNGNTINDPADFAAAVQATITAAHWGPATCGAAVCDNTSANAVSVNWASASTMLAGASLQRLRSPDGVAVDTHLRADWQLVPSTFGALNP